MKKASKLNVLHPQKLHLLLSRCLFLLSSTEEYVFWLNDEQREKFIKSINTSSKELDEILNIIKNILYESLQNTIQPSALRELLIKEGMQETHAQIFCDQWAENGKAVVNRFKKVSLAKWQMKGMTWEVHAETSSSNTSRQKHPIAVFNLNLHESDSPLNFQPGQKLRDSKDLTFQMDKEELYQFYNELEKIQNQLESLKQ